MLIANDALADGIIDTSRSSKRLGLKTTVGLFRPTVSTNIGMFRGQLDASGIPRSFAAKIIELADKFLADGIATPLFVPS